MTIDEVVRRFDNPRKTSNGYMVKCPCHNDTNASLSISEGEGGRILLKCFAGCDTNAVLSAKGLKMQDLFNDPVRHSGTMPREVAHYDYYTQDGAPLLRVVRFEPGKNGQKKSFVRHAPDGRGGWKEATNGETKGIHGLYHWPELAEACRNHVPCVWVVEGEKDVDRFCALGPDVVATTADGGSSKWRAEYAAEFAGAGAVAVIADNDSAGRRHALRVRDSLRGVGLPCTAFTLPPEIGGKNIKDASNAIAAGWKLENFEKWAKIAPELEQDADEEEGDGENVRELKAAIDSALVALHDKTDGHVKEAVEAQVAAEVGVEWLLTHGRFFNEKEFEGKACGTYYFHTPTKELFYMGEKFDSLNSEFAPWLSYMSGLTRVGGKFRRLYIDCQTAAAKGERTTVVSPGRYWDCRNVGGHEVVYISNGEGQMCRIAPNEEIEMVLNGSDNMLFLKENTLRRWELVPFEEIRCPLDCDLFKTMTVENENMRLLFLFWLAALPLNLRTKPPLLLCGPTNSGKTHTAKGVSWLMFGSGRPRILSVDSEKDDAFWVSMHNGGVVTVDNQDRVCKWLANAVEEAASDGSKESRKLYTDKDKVECGANASLIITSKRTNFANASGLASRLLTVMLDVDQDRNNLESEHEKDILEKRNACLSWIAYVIRGAMETPENPPESFNMRHPEWSKWVWRMGVYLHMREEVENCLATSECNKSKMFFEADTIAYAVLKIVRKRGQITATCAELLAMIRADGLLSQKVRDELTPKGLGRRILSCKEHYKRYLDMEETWKNGIRAYTFTPPAEVGEEDDNAAAEVGGCDNYNPGDEATLDL